MCIRMYVGASTHVLPELIAESDAHLSNSFPEMTVQHCHQVHIWGTCNNNYINIAWL